MSATITVGGEPVLQPGEGYVEHDGLRLHYRVEGQGPVCLAHPGGPAGDGRYFIDLAGLSSFLTVIFFDPRGSDFSSWPSDPTRYGLSDHAADVEALRLQLGLDKFIFLGHSWGGLVAHRYALDYPHGLSHLILASTPATLADVGQRVVATIEKRRDEPWYPAARAAFDKEWAGEFATGRELGELYVAELPFYFGEWNEAARRYAAIFEGHAINVDAVKHFTTVEAPQLDLRPSLPEIRVPTLLLTGEDDLFADPDGAREMAALIPDAELCIMERCGHFTFVDNPELFRETIRRFVNR